MSAVDLNAPLPKHRKRRKRIIRTAYMLIGLFLLLIILANCVISSNAKGKLFTSVDTCPAVEMALVPGTSKTLPSGRENQFFTNRINATVELYEAGKVRSILLSGDRSKGYNEPGMMREALIAKGIPASVIHEDHAGFDTWDSMERAKRVFGKRKLLVVSQQFQNERAIYIGESLGMEILGYNARDVESYGSFLTLLREKFARLKVFWNIWFN